MINKKQCKDFILEYAKRTRAKNFERVSAEVYEWLVLRLRQTCRECVDSMPSMGKTIYPPIRINTTKKEEEN